MSEYDDPDFEHDPMPSACLCCGEVVDFRDCKPDPRNRQRLICRKCADRRHKELRNMGGEGNG